MISLPVIYAEQRRWLMIRLVFNGIFQALMVVGSMLLVRHAFNVLLNPEYDDPEVHMFETTEVWQIVIFAIALLGCTGFAAYLRYVERIDAERLGQEYVHRVRLSIFDRMKSFAPRALGQRSTGASALRFIGDLSAIRRWVSLGLARIVVSSIVTVISIGVLGYLDIYLAISSVLILSFGLIWNLRMGPKMHREVSESRRLRGRLAGNINEKIRSFIVIQAFNQQQRERRRFSKQSRLLREAMVNRARASASMRVVNEGATALSMAAILSIGAFEVFRSITNSGNVVAAMVVVGFLSNAFRDMGRVHEYLQTYRVSREKILEFMQTKPLRGRSRKLPDLQVENGEIELKRIRIRGALRRISGTIPAGTKLAICGDNGAGKSTLLQAIARLVDLDGGKILIDGQDIRRCNLASIRQAVSIVSPDLPLLKGSVRYNLSYRKPDASNEEKQRIKTLCEIDQLLEKLPGGEDFRINEGGQNLSLGQRHKLAIARALLGNPAILIVDEMDANLDEQAVQVLEKVIAGFPGTVLMVSRSTERLSLADHSWQLEAGRLINTTNNETSEQLNAAEAEPDGVADE